MPPTMDGQTDTRLINKDLAPTQTRTWAWSDYLFLWMSNVHSVAGYVTAGSLFAMGLPAMDVFLALLLAICVVQLGSNLVAQPSFVSGSPFPVVARMAFGVHGAIVPAFVRGAIAVGWYGIQTWLASNALLILALKIWPYLASWAEVQQLGFAGLSTLGWATFMTVWLLQLLLFWRGMEAIRHFIDWAGPAIYIMMIALDGWLLWHAHGQIDFHVFDTAENGNFTKRVLGVLNAVSLTVAYFSPIILNFGDFSRYGKSMQDIRVGNFWGLPVNFMGFSILTLVTILLTQPVFGRIILDPVETITQIDSLSIIVVGMATFLIATIGINISANFVSAAFDFSNLSPRILSWRKGGVIAAVGAILVTPWNLYTRPELIHFTLDVLGTFIAPLIGILLSDYYLVQKKMVDVQALYSDSPAARYWYRKGVNLRALFALIAGVGCGLIIIFTQHYMAFRNFSWIAGFCVGGISYTGLSLLLPRSHKQPQPSP
ncbi:APC transporter NCS1 [Acetobacter tropicalis NBRC 101654]|uniref:APC transporter NCS1 n=1 Tax=Acetobacter tropicalis NBRC 101654 TaxID=749388 RepID=F7VGL8_9PROT|nr:NCS1 family nucleobase:cation symporter-1 [Acetobacter tropicalis]GAA09513.1 APC transporter NCS1 [Acetobacter tropicalis NBRC 101654]